MPRRKIVKPPHHDELKPCPCCGEAEPMRWVGEDIEGLLAGVMSATSQGVHCYTCRLRLERNYPDDWPAYTKGMNVEKSLEAIKQHTLREAIEAWNRRTP